MDLLDKYRNAIGLATELFNKFRDQPAVQIRIAELGETLDELAKSNPIIAGAKRQVAQDDAEKKFAIQLARAQEAKRRSIATFSDPRYIAASRLRAAVEEKRCSKDTLEYAIDAERGLYPSAQIRSDLYQVLEQPEFQENPTKALANLYAYYLNRPGGREMIIAHNIIKKYCPNGLTESD